MLKIHNGQKLKESDFGKDWLDSYWMKFIKLLAEEEAKEKEKKEQESNGKQPGVDISAKKTEIT